MFTSTESSAKRDVLSNERNETELCTADKSPVGGGVMLSIIRTGSNMISGETDVDRIYHIIRLLENVEG